jgi:hypothetical protein
MDRTFRLKQSIEKKKKKKKEKKVEKNTKDD